MNILRGAVAVLFLAAVVATGVVVAHGGGKVDQAGAVVGYDPPVRGQRLLVVGDSFSISLDSGQDSWVKLFTDANQMKPMASAIANTGFLTNRGGGTFLHRVEVIQRELATASSTASSNAAADVSSAEPPNWAIIWGAWDDFQNVSEKHGKAFAAFQQQLAGAVRKTLEAAKALVPAGHLILIGPADGPQINEKQAQALDGTENFVASRLNVHYISPVAEHWFTTDPATQQDNRGFISIKDTPTDDGQVHILAELEGALANLQHVHLGQDGQRATDPVPPVLPTTTPAPVTSVSIATVTKSAPVTRTITAPATTVTLPPVIVTPPPQVVTVTVAPTR